MYLASFMNLFVTIEMFIENFGHDLWRRFLKYCENLYGSWKKVIIWFHPDIWQNTYIV
jgi:hypothetical protein